MPGGDSTSRRSAATTITEEILDPARHRLMAGVSGMPKRKLENGEQRLAPQSHQSRPESPEFARQRLGRASITRVNVGSTGSANLSPSHIEPVSVCRNGNWKTASRDWRRKGTGPDPKVRNLLTRDCGAPA